MVSFKTRLNKQILYIYTYNIYTYTYNITKDQFHYVQDLEHVQTVPIVSNNLYLLTPKITQDVDSIFRQY